MASVPADRRGTDPTTDPHRDRHPDGDPAYGRSAGRPVYGAPADPRVAAGAGGAPRYAATPLRAVPPTIPLAGYRGPHQAIANGGGNAPPPSGHSSPMRYGAVARYEQAQAAHQRERQRDRWQQSTPPALPAYLARDSHGAAADPYERAAGGGPFSAPNWPGGIPSAPSLPSLPTPPGLPLDRDERAQYLVLKEFYEIVTGPEKGGERARRLRAIAGAVGLPLTENPLTAGQPALDSDAMLHRWLRWVRYCREHGDLEPFVHLVSSALYGDAFWHARVEGERWCARALKTLYAQYGAPGQVPDPRRRPFAFSDHTLLQAVAAEMGVRWTPASPEYQRDLADQLRSARQTVRPRPPLVALLMTPDGPAGPIGLAGAANGPVGGGMGDRGPGDPTPRPLAGPCILVLTTDPAYMRALNWDFACMLGYLTLLRPFFVGSGHPGDYRWLPHPQEDTSITPHLHQFALALTSEEACPAELRCECQRVNWTLNLPPPLHPQPSDALDVRAVEAYEAAHDAVRPSPRSLPRRAAPGGALGGAGTPTPQTVPTAPHRPTDTPIYPLPVSSVPLAGLIGSSVPGAAPPSPALPLPSAPVPFAEWPAPDDSPPLPIPIPMMPAGTSDAPRNAGEPEAAGAYDGSDDGSGVVYHRTVIDLYREQLERQRERERLGQSASAAAPTPTAEADAVWSGNTADLVDADLRGTVGLDGSPDTGGLDGSPDTGEPDTGATHPSVPPMVVAAPVARSWDTPVLPVRRPHRGKGKP